MTEVSLHQLAGLIGVSTRTVTDLARRKVVVKAQTRGQYDLIPSVQGYCAQLREAAAGRGGEDQVATLTSERARLAREQADAASLKNATLRGAVLPAADVEREWTAILRTVRAGMLAVPSRVQQQASHLSAADVGVIDREIREALGDLGGREPHAA